MLITTPMISSTFTIMGPPGYLIGQILGMTFPIVKNAHQKGERKSAANYAIDTVLRDVEQIIAEITKKIILKEEEVIDQVTKNLSAAIVKRQWDIVLLLKEKLGDPESRSVLEAEIAKLEKKLRADISELKRTSNENQ